MTVFQAVIVLVPIAFIVWFVKMLEKELPKRDERIRREHEEKIEREKEEERKKYLETKKSLTEINIENGKKYEAFVAEHFRKLEYIVWEHGKEKGFEDKNIDLFVMNKEEAFFVQCKYYRKSTIDHHVVKATREDIRSYMKEKKELTKLISNRKKKILYVVPRECLTPGAWRYIKENNDIMDYKVIPMEA